MNKKFTEETQASDKHTKRCSNFSADTELESKTMKYHFILVSLANVLSL